MITLSMAQVRLVMLAAQGLLSPPAEAATRASLLPAIRRMGYLQIDTIHAVHRSQNLVLWSRLGTYDVDWLDQVHAEGHLFEYYAHALCYIPIEDFPIFRGLILYEDRTGNYWQGWAAEHPEIVEKVRAIVEKQGPVCSLDLEGETISNGWGAVKHEKLALERMFAKGDLMVTRRENFRRFYDLRERVLPDWDDANALDPAEGNRLLFLQSVRALGVARGDWVAPYYYRLKTGLAQALASLAAEGKLIPVTVAGWEAPAYVHPENWPLVEAALAGELVPTYTTLLSPFDPLVSDRDRALALFNFDYRLEAYTPAKDRVYGYFSLPILRRGRLVGRLDPKAHRKEKRLEVRAIHLEPGVEVRDGLAADLKVTLDAFTAWHGLEQWEVTATNPAELMEALA